MSRRGRPPHPDILTPREWEVLALLREGLSDEAIAERLGLSIHGAKYHVREILSKLGVSSRQEAAAWQPEEQAPAGRWLALPLAARIGAALVIVAAVAGLGLLAWGVVRTDGPSDETVAADGGNTLGLPTPGVSPQLSADEALLRAAAMGGGRGIQEVQGGLTTWSAAKAAAGDTGFAPSDPPGDAPAWFYRFRGMFVQLSFYPPPISEATRTPPQPACSDTIVLFPDDSEGGGVTVTGAIAPGECSGSVPTSRELAVVLAGAPFWLHQQSPRVEATLTTYDRATNQIDQDSGGSGISTEDEITGDTQVWQVIVTGGVLYGQGNRPEGGGTPFPTTILACERHFVVVDANDPDILMEVSSPSDACD